TPNRRSAGWTVLAQGANVFWRRFRTAIEPRSLPTDRTEEHVSGPHLPWTKDAAQRRAASPARGGASDMGSVEVEAVFWLAALTVAYTYGGYLALLLLLARFRARPPIRTADVLPRASLVVVAYNEELRLEA